MPKRRKHLRLPSGWGSIRYLGKGRRNCYAVHPPSTEDSDTGTYARQKALCYVDDWYVGFAVLQNYHAGTYNQGDELTYPHPSVKSDLDATCAMLLNDFLLKSSNKAGGKTFSEVYQDFYSWKFGPHAPKKLSESTKKIIEFAYNKCSVLHDRPFSSIRLDDMQKILDDCTGKKASLEQILTFLHQLYKYAESRELCDKDYSRHLVLPDAEEDEHGEPFSEDDLRILWSFKDDPVAEMILIMIYSGYRISAYKTIEVNLAEKYFKGGVKTTSSKGRIVPIHSAILPLVKSRLKRGNLLEDTPQLFRTRMYAFLDAHKIKRHTPHDTRHTFSMLCEKYGVNENDRKRMLGHVIGDLTNDVYGHRTVEDLRSEIEKIIVTSL